MVEKQLDRTCNNPCGRDCCLMDIKAKRQPDIKEGTGKADKGSATGEHQISEDNPAITVGYGGDQEANESAQERG